MSESLKYENALMNQIDTGKYFAGQNTTGIVNSVIRGPYDEWV